MTPLSSSGYPMIIYTHRIRSYNQFSHTKFSQYVITCNKCTCTCSSSCILGPQLFGHIIGSLYWFVCNMYMYVHWHTLDGKHINFVFCAWVVHGLVWIRDIIHTCILLLMVHVCYINCFTVCCSEETMKRLLANMFSSEHPSDVVIVNGISVLLTALERRYVLHT